MLKSSTQVDRRWMRINADDFGFSTGVNQAIITAHQQGVLTSTSIMVTGDAADEAIELAKANPSLAVGLHLVVGMGRSALPPEQIPHLVDAEGNFPDDPAWAGLRYQFSAKARQELPLEIRAQLEKFRRTGLKLSHVDGHLHLHAHPVILRHLVDLAKEFEIPEIRLPSEELSIALEIDRSGWIAKTVGSLVFSGLRRYGENLLKKHRIQFADRVYGLLQTGQITESYLLELIPKITANRVEIYSHPAITVPGEPSNAPLNLGFVELEALLSDRVRAALEAYGFELAVGSNP
ncbi:hopanoid biosynthesis-associated protein HpnK [Leptolyngbya sp. FACHB-17]|uniref:hopanoid biosynthesis-associated protein HpnK n=1 Tax=unclassified Leptolyngbya TaxID=2650499 RepID=UPI0016810A5D|nr:hopanoid biosynthesis-associated protein HpnK [Leptolyngbya sp. FACHB-17]MBD2081007.1 hopanoid biosynthesis-associated protein HpnK [Leptolyngbya sp. FACHB-17]